MASLRVPADRAQPYASYEDTKRFIISYYARFSFKQSDVPQQKTRESERDTVWGNHEQNKQVMAKGGKRGYFCQTTWHWPTENRTSNHLYYYIITTLWREYS